MQRNLCGKYCVGNVIYHKTSPKKLKTRETKYVEINNIVYMELYSGAKMVNEKDLKTKYMRSKNREFTVYEFHIIIMTIQLCDPVFSVLLSLFSSAPAVSAATLITIPHLLSNLSFDFAHISY
jgi:hypothetical protein